MATCLKQNGKLTKKMKRQYRKNMTGTEGGSLAAKMVRNYVKKKTTNYTDNDAKRAVELVEAGQSLRSAAQQTGVPVTSLNRWVMKGLPHQHGSGSIRAVLTHSEEEMVVVALEQCGRMGWPVGFEEVKSMVKSYLDSLKRQTRFVDNVPGKDWCISFKKRWSEQLRMKRPEILTKARSSNLSRENLSKLFEMVELEYNRIGLFEDDDAAHRIYNLDETGCNTDPSGKKLFFSKKAKDAYMLAPNCGKTMYTVLFAGNAAGEFLAPLVVYKSKHMYETWTKGGPDSCQFAISDSGWMTDIVFENWFRDYFVPAVANKKNPVVVFCDGHGSHLTYNTVAIAEAEQIVIMCIPPHTSHALQPLDVAVFGPLKINWRKLLTKFFRETQMATVSKPVFPSLLKQLCEKMQPSHLVGGFRGTGLWPFNPNAVRADKIIEVSEEEQSTSQSETATPRKLLRNAIVEAIAPQLSQVNKQAVENSQKKRKRVQATHGEVLTSASTIERMRQEEESRKLKQEKKKQHPAAARELILPEQSESEEEDVKCKFCTRWWSTYKGKKGDQWLQCDLCDEYICPKCMPAEINLQEDYYCKQCCE